MPGVKSIGPLNMRVKARLGMWEGGLPPSLLQALNSWPRAPSRDIRLGHVRRSPVPVTGSWMSSAIEYLAAVSTVFW